MEVWRSLATEELGTFRKVERYLASKGSLPVVDHSALTGTCKAAE